MANAFSIQADFGDYIQPINTELVNFVLSSKQQKYDYNVAKIDETIAEFGLDLVRQKDKDYVLQKLNGVLDSVNSMAKMDLSKGNVTRNVQQQIRGTLDDTMIQAAVSSKNYKDFVSSLQQIKEKNPDQYSDINAAYAMDRGGVNSWLNEEVDALGSVSYTPYQDVNETVTKNIKSLKEFNPERTLEIPYTDPATGARRIITKKVKDLNEAEIRSFVMSNLDANAQNQLKINGWASFNGVPDNELTDFASNYKTRRTKNYDDNIALLRKQLESAPSYLAEDIRNRINVLQSEKTSFNQTMDNVGSNRDEIGRVIMQEQLVDDVSRAYADTSVSFELKTDTAYYKQAKLEMDKAQALLKAQQQNKPIGSGAIQNPQIQVVEGTAVHEETFDPEERTNDIIKNQEAQADAIAQGIVANMDEQTKQLFNSAKQQNPSLSDAEVLQQTGLDPTYVDANGDTRFFSQVMNDLKDTYEDATDSYRQTMENRFAENLDDIYSEITSEGFFNNNEFPLIQEDGSLVQMDTYLKERGITLEDFKNNVGGVQDRVKKSLYLNKALNVATGLQSADSGQRRNTTNATKSFILRPSDFHAMDNYIKAMDSNDDIFNYVDFVDPASGEVLQRDEVDDVGTGFTGRSGKGFQIVPKTATAKAMFNFFNQRSGIGTDARVSSEGRLNNIISFDTAAFKKDLTDNFAAQSNRNLVIRPNLGKGGKELSNVHLQIKDFIDGRFTRDIDAKKAFTIQESLFNPNEVLIFQNDEDFEPVSVSKQELSGILNIDLNNVKGQEVVINKEVINRDIFPLNTDKASHMTKANVLVGMMQRGELLPSPVMSNSDIKGALKLTTGYVDADSGEKTQAGLLADQLLADNFRNLSVAYRPNADGGFVTIMDKNTQEEIKSYPVTGRERILATRNTVRYNPQFFVANMIGDMFTSFNAEGTNSDLFNRILQTQTQNGRRN